MIQANGVSKYYDNILAVDNISVEMREGSVFGLVGTNGAGKSTFLRMLAGVLKPDSGEILVDGMKVYENCEMKEKIFYISDDQFFYGNGTPVDMMKYYQIYYPEFNKERFISMLHKFGLDKNRKIRTFSKGMKKQLSVILGICSGSKYLLCDETFDGLDPVMRQAVKGILAGEILEREFTPIIASHNLRELEDICDHVGILHKGGVLMSRDLEELKVNIHKVQCVLENQASLELVKDSLEVLKFEKRGSLCLMTVRGNEEDILATINSQQPLFCELLPLSLEEIFISETEVVGYDIQKLIF